MKYRLYVPEGQEKLDSATEEALSRDAAHSLEGTLEVSVQPRAKNASDVCALFGVDSADPEPFLEMRVAGEMACLVHYRGDDLQEELMRLLGISTPAAD